MVRTESFETEPGNVKNRSDYKLITAIKKAPGSALALFLCAPGRAHLLGRESPLLTRQGEELARGKGGRVIDRPEEARGKALA